MKDKTTKEERAKKQYARQNAFINEKYDRINLTLPKGTKERIRAACKEESVNAFILKAVNDEITRLERQAAIAKLKEELKKQEEKS